MKDEYNDIYNEFGYRFDYSKKHLGKSKELSIDEIRKIDDSKSNNNDIPIFIRCKQCDTYMEFKPGPENLLDGCWVCPICNSKVKEITPYTKLESENSAFLDSWDVD
ncbi:hypothetical protein [Anaerostipes sp. PC18]|uniref:hypothetical protein n=1 Tax=Anaerostipes sp. PC18 TaxID=3036926 RepID=UPI0030922141|nr:hypothetical protein P8F77_10235 [Anaerostipes sp. PC18]